MCLDCGCSAASSEMHKKSHSHVKNSGSQVLVHEIHIHHHQYYHDHKHDHDHHHHDHEHDHHHDHEHDHDHHQDKKTMDIGRLVLEKNQDFAQKNRRFFSQRGTLCLNFMSSPGSGKTTFLEKTLEFLAGKLPVCVLVGDLSTQNDALRMSGKGAPVKQINTVSSCHLDAQMIYQELEIIEENHSKILFIENVGNLVCPAAFDLGQDANITLLSVTEGEDKPLKYPVMFHHSDLVLITKTDLLEHLDFNLEQCVKNIRQVSPKATIIALNSKNQDGFEHWIHWLSQRIS